MKDSLSTKIEILTIKPNSKYVMQATTTAIAKWLKKFGIKEHSLFCPNTLMHNVPKWSVTL